MKQTAVEWLINQLFNESTVEVTKENNPSLFEVLEQAKEMAERQELKMPDYDLDELANFYSTSTLFIKNKELPTQQQIEDAEHISEISFKAGFQKAIELLTFKSE